MKKPIIVSILLFLVFQIYVVGQIPVGYYNSIDGKQNSELKTALHKILKEHTVLSYNNLWYYFRTTDVRPDGSAWDMYSGTKRYYDPPVNSNRSVSGMDREHALPKSWWATSDQVHRYVAYSDLNHLYPSDATANGYKLNYILGEVTETTFDNGVSKIGRNIYSYAGSPTTVRAFEPADEYKGDFARAYMYMVTCYEDYAQQWRTESLYMFDKETYPVLKPWVRQMLLKWHRNDPVSEKEQNRNEEVYRYQNNRNPFIDFPQLAEYIWGDSVSYTFKLPEQYYAYTPVLVTPVNLTDLYFGEIQEDWEISQTIILKGHYLTGNISVMLWGGDVRFFNVSSVTAPSSDVNSEEGYELEIFYHPKEYGEHITALIIQDGGMAGSSVVYLKGICSADAPSGIVQTGTQSSDVYVQNDVIHFRTYTPDNKVSIYNSLGKLIHSETGTGKWQEFKCPQSGIYIIQINGKALKTVVK